MEVQEGIDDSLKILQLARAGRRVYLFNLLRRTAKQQGVYVSDVIVEMKDSQSRGIAHYCAEGASVAAEGKSIRILITHTIPPSMWLE